MRSGLRLTVFLLLLAGVAAAGWQYYRLELDTIASLSETAQLDEFRDEIHRAVAQARTSQQAYVAPGQGLDFWRTRFAEAIADLTGALENLRVTADELPEATEALDATDRALKVYVGLDGTIRRYVETGSLLMAADAVYEDGVKTSRLIVDHVDEVHRLLATPHALAAEQNRRQQRWLAGGALAGALLVALLLVPRGRPADDEAGRAAPDTSASTYASREWRLDERRETPERTAATPAAAEAPAPTPPPVSPPPVIAPAAPPVGQSPTTAIADERALVAAAQVCTDLARVKDGDELRDALGRAARALDASGVIVWIADADGRALKPLLTYGYPEAALRRIPTLPRDADNATAAAWRDSTTQVVEATDAAPGAVAVPILGPQGCTGVLAAEIGHHREGATYTTAVARLVAAQLAVLIPPETPDAEA